MSERLLISSGTPWETAVGYSRAVRVDKWVYVAGTTASNEQGEIQGANAYEQTVYILEKISRALTQAGASLRHVVRTRMYIVDVAHQDEVGRAHQQYFGEIRPVATMVEIKGLVNPSMLVEIEVEAYLHDA